MGLLPKQTAFKGVRVILFGPESTGKSTMATYLAHFFSAPVAGEYMRSYLQNKWDKNEQTCAYNDLLPIAKGQATAENNALKQDKNLVFYDTNVRQLKVYADIYYARVPEPIDDYLSSATYDLYLLMDNSVAWTPDDLRDKPQERDTMFQRFRTELIENNLAFSEISGTGNTRNEMAVQAVRDYLNKWN